MFEFLNTGPHFVAKSVPKKHTQNVNLGIKAKLCAKYQFFMYVSWLKIGLTTKMNSCLFEIIKSSVSRYLVTWTNLLYFPLGVFSYSQIKNQVGRNNTKNFQK